MKNNNPIYNIFWVTLFAVAMAFVESAVVVYLRAIFYPGGFSFPLRAMVDYKIFVEVMREVATLVMLAVIAHIAGRKFWERFGYLMISFGVWDIFYYVWLKVLLDWPASLLEWDVLFLIPLPWIGPVIAPVSISVLMVIFGVLIVYAIRKGQEFKPAVMSYILAFAGVIIVLYSFLYDVDATLHQQVPKPYQYELLILGDILFIASFLISYLKCRDKACLAPSSN